MQRCSTLINPINVLQHRPYELVSAPQKRILGGVSRGSYPAQVTVYPYNEYIRGTNPVVRHVMSLTWTPTRILANQRTPNHAKTQPLHDSNTRARAPNLVASQELTGGYSYPASVTVYRYNGHIAGTNLALLLWSAFKWAMTMLCVCETAQPQPSCSVDFV